MRLGILGGTFNPIHIAHLRIAEEVRESLALDHLLFVPAASPPHKLMEAELPFDLRCSLVASAIADNHYFSLSTIEGERRGKSYSVDTLRTLTKQRSSDQLFFIVGSDSFLEIASWHEYEMIFSLCDIVVVDRPGVEISDLKTALPETIRDCFDFDIASNRLDHRSGHSVHHIGDCLIDISSTRIRQLARQGSSIRYLVMPEVERQIIEKGLYIDEGHAEA